MTPDPDPRVPDGFMAEPEPKSRLGCFAALPAFLLLLAALYLWTGTAALPVIHAQLLAGSRSGAVDAPVPALPAPTGAIGSVLLGGFATWYTTPGLTAAAGPVLRDVLGPDWRGQWVEVESGSRSVTVRISDWCACRNRHGLPTLIDLSDAAFRELAPLSAGVVRVSIEIGPAPHEADDRMRVEDGGPQPTLPATSTEGG